MLDIALVRTFGSAAELSALAGASAIKFVLFAICFGPQTACAIIVAAAYGARDRQQLDEAIISMLKLHLTIALVAASVGFSFINDVLAWLHWPAELRDEGSTYCQIILLTLPLSNLSGCIFMIARAMGDGQLALKVTCGSILLNATMVIAVMNGYTPWHVPILLMLALSDLLTQSVCLVFLVSKFLRTGDRFSGILEAGNLSHFSLKVCGRAVSLGIPIGSQLLISSVSNAKVVAAMNAAFPALSPAYAVLNTMWNFEFVLPLAVGAATTVLCSQALGKNAHDRANPIFRTAFIFSIAVTGVVYVAVTLVQLICLRFWSDDLWKYVAQINFFVGWFVILQAGSIAINSWMKSYSVVWTPVFIFLSIQSIVRLPIVLLSSDSRSESLFWLSFPITSCASLMTIWFVWSKLVRPRVN